MLITPVEDQNGEQEKEQGLTTTFTESKLGIFLPSQFEVLDKLSPHSIYA